MVDDIVAINVQHQVMTKTCKNILKYQGHKEKSIFPKVRDLDTVSRDVKVVLNKLQVAAVSPRPSPSRYFLIFVAQQAPCPNRKYLNLLTFLHYFTFPFFQDCIGYFNRLSFSFRQYSNKKCWLLFLKKQLHSGRWMGEKGI